MTPKSQEPTKLQQAPGLSAVRLFALGPLLALTILGASYLLLRAHLPSHVVRHVGPDGVGLSPTWLVLLIGAGIAAILFTVAWCCARDFWKHDHWYQTQKTIVVGFVAAGYAVTGLLLVSLLSVLGLDTGAASPNSVGYGLLAFLLVLIFAAWGYVLLLPAGKFEEPWQR